MTSWRRWPVMRSAPSLHKTIFFCISTTHTPVKRLSEDVATNVELVKGGHAVGFRLLWFIGRNSQTLQPDEPGKAR